jgi:hypothetical protein
MFIDKGGVSRKFIDVYDLDKDNEIGIELGDENNSGLIYLTIEEVKQVIEHLQKQISSKRDTGAGFQGESKGDGLSGFRG